MGSYKYWPREATELAEEIQREQRVLLSTLKTGINEGLDQQNYELVEKLLPRMRARAETIKATSREIQRRFTPEKRGRGRLPGWVEGVMEITALADRVMRCVELVGPETQGNRWVTGDFLLRGKCLALVRRIGEQVEAIAPLPSQPDEVRIPAVIREIFNDDQLF